MPICIECGHRIARTYTTYSKADDRSLGKGVRLTQCPRCKRFADKYVEHDYVILFLDLVLIKPQVYRHLLFNRLHRDDEKLDPSIIRLGILLLLFDVYLTWVRIEKATSLWTADGSILSPPLPLPFAAQGEGPSRSLTSNSTQSNHGVMSDSTSPASGSATFYSTQPMMLQYLFFLTLCSLETAALHLPIQLLLSPRLPSRWRAWLFSSTQQPPRPATISTALFVSSFTKLFPLLLLIWRYDLPSAASTISWAVIVNNVAALAILLDCGIATAVVLAAVGAVCRAGVGWVRIILSHADVVRGLTSLAVYAQGCRRGIGRCGGRCGGDGRLARAAQVCRSELWFGGNVIIFTFMINTMYMIMIMFGLSAPHMKRKNDYCQRNQNMSMGH